MLTARMCTAVDDVMTHGGQEMPDRGKFVQAIRDKQMIELQFYSKEDRTTLIRHCAPMDFGPSSRAHDKNDRYHMWDFDSDKKNHTLSLSPEQVVSMRLMDRSFDPASFVTWKTAWIVLRDWGQYS
jgi:hypothetical protein